MNFQPNTGDITPVPMGKYRAKVTDGKEVGSSAVLGPVAFDFPLNGTMGKHGHLKTSFEFAGDLDEAEIHSVARSPEWMGLSYQNQKPGAAFPVLGKTTGP